MKFPLNWLKEYVDIPSDVDELTQKLTAIGHMQDKKPERVGDDVLIDLEVRQNRPDCLSVVGVAREVAAVTGKEIKIQSAKFKAQSNNIQGDLHINNSAPDLCKRFKACRIRVDSRQSTVDSPEWMKKRLHAYGIKTISPLVDITNYVTIELGEPLHAFDVRHIEGGELVIRRASDGEKLTILGGKVLSLTNDDLVIASKSKALSLAGMIGGAESGVQSDTTEIILEAATYNQASIRRSSIRHSVRTEASTRHEKFLHPHLAEVALERAANLIVEICGGEIVAHADSYPNPVNEITIDLRLSEIERLGGVSISAKDAGNYLASLGFTIVRISPMKSGQANLEFRVSVPYWRTDIEQEADLVEEILRLYGYENIPASLPPFPSPNNITSYWFKLEEKIRDIMLQLGFDEQITEPLTKSNPKFETLNSNNGKQIRLQNALNADKNALRTDLTEGLTYALTHQKKFGKESIRLFELGKVYGETGDKKNPYFESRQLGFIIFDSSAQKEASYLTAKGVVETLCKMLVFEFSDVMYSIQLLDENTAFCTVEIEKYWGPGVTKIMTEIMLHTDIPQILRFDISFEVHVDTAVGDVIQSLRKVHTSLDTVVLGETKTIGPDRKSVLLRFTSFEHASNKRSFIHNVEKSLVDLYDAVIR